MVVPKRSRKQPFAFDATFTNGYELPVDGGMTQL
jgi:hypothetical protein